MKKQFSGHTLLDSRWSEETPICATYALACRSSTVIGGNTHAAIMEPFEAVNARNQPFLTHPAATLCGAAWPQPSQVQDSILKRKVLSNSLAAQ